MSVFSLKRHLRVVLRVVQRQAGVNLKFPYGVDDPFAAQVEHAHVGLAVLILDDLEALVHVATVHSWFARSISYTNVRRDF